MIDGVKHFPTEHDAQYSRIFIGAAWPGVRAGWIVVVGEHGSEYWLGRPRLDVLDEDTADRLHSLVGKVAAMREYYHPECVLADGRDVAAMQFVAEVGKGVLRVEHSLLCEMAGPLAYAAPVLSQMYEPRRPGNRLVIPRASRLVGELMTVPRSEDLGKLKLADYPGVAALAFAAIGLDLSWRDPGTVRPTQVDWR